MSRRTLARAALSAGAATLLVVGLSGAGSAAPGDDVVSVSGEASGLFVAVDLVQPLAASQPSFFTDGDAGDAGDPVDAQQLDVEFGPAPIVTLPPEGGGPITDSLADVDVDDLGIFTVAALEVSTEGALGTAGNARSSSSALGLYLGGLTADEASSTCEATSAGATADTTIIGLAGFEDEPIDVPEHPAPNTALTSAEIPNLDVGVTVFLNEQELVTDATGSHVVVTALRIESVSESDILGDLYVGRSECGVTTVAPVIVEPTFTG